MSTARSPSTSSRPLRALVPVEPRLDPAAVAVATDALGTPYHALRTVAGVQRGETVAVIGVGGIGSGAVQIGAHLGARVIAIGRSAAKLATARELGATVTIESSAGAEAIIEAAGGQIDVVVQCAGESSGSIGSPSTSRDSAVESSSSGSPASRSR